MEMKDLKSKYKKLETKYRNLQKQIEEQGMNEEEESEEEEKDQIEGRGMNEEEGSEEEEGQDATLGPGADAKASSANTSSSVAVQNSPQGFYGESNPGFIPQTSLEQDLENARNK